MTCVMAILNYNDASRARELALKCAQYRTVEKVVIIDNKSTDDSMTVLNQIKDDRIEILQSDKNGGFSYGNNILGKYICREYNPKYILYANTDTIFEEHNIRRCIQAMESHPDLGLVSTRMKGPDGKEQLVAWKYSTYRDHLLNSFWIHRRKYYINNQLKEKKYNEEFEYVDIVRGSFMLFRAEALKKADFFDDSVFLYAEETIISKRLQNVGYRVGVLTNVWYIHNHIEKHKNKIDGYTSLKRMFDSCYYYQSTYGKINAFQKAILKICNQYGLFEQKIIDVIKNTRK